MRDVVSSILIFLVLNLQAAFNTSYSEDEGDGVVAR